MNQEWEIQLPQNNQGSPKQPQKLIERVTPNP